MLSKRLKAISDFIPNGSKVIDVGADHALLDIYLAKEKNCQCLATDISSKCLEKAKENIKKYKADVKIKRCDGLKGLKISDEIIILSGMGTKTILEIIPDNLENDFIISSHHDLVTLRKQMHKKGYYIYNEKVVFDKHYYVIMHFKRGKRKIDYYVSPFLTYDKDYMHHLLKKYEVIFSNTKQKLLKLKVYLIIKKIKRFL